MSSGDARGENFLIRAVAVAALAAAVISSCVPPANAQVNPLLLMMLMGIKPIPLALLARHRLRCPAVSALLVSTDTKRQLLLPRKPPDCHPVGSQQTHKVHRPFGGHLISACRCSADTLPNALFVYDPAVVSDKRLDGWFVKFFEDCCVLLTFRHNFNLEASDLDPNLGFDGGVLELSTDGGNTFQDILAAGGGFGRGYNRTIATDRGSPIAGRRA